eukprot:scaffold25831_cov52-Phaeocystis_antarctica.AAC.2
MSRRNAPATRTSIQTFGHKVSNGHPTGAQRAHLGRSLGVATLHFLGPNGTPGGCRAYTRELEDYVTPRVEAVAGFRFPGGW